MNDQPLVERDGQESHRTGACGSELPDTEGATDISPHFLSAIKECRKCLGAVSQILRCLSVAAMYDRAIDTASSGVADIARRIIDETIKQLELVERELSDHESGPDRRGALT